MVDEDVKLQVQDPTRRSTKKGTKQRKKLSAPTANDESPAVVDALKALTPEVYRKKHGIIVSSMAKANTAAILLQNFEAVKATFGAQMVAALQAQGYEAPTPVQAQTWPLVHQGHDVVAIAATGSGKTCAFALPLVSRLATSLSASPARAAAAPRAGGAPEGSWVCTFCHNTNWPQRMICNTRTCKAPRPSELAPHKAASALSTARPARPYSLVLAPARELAQQIFEEIKRLAAVSNESARIACIYGGVPKGEQATALTSAGADIVVATPGRCLDFIREDAMLGTPLALDAVKYLVLDEADRMLEAGFLPELRRIVEACPSAGEATGGSPLRQSLFFTATWPPEVQAAAKEIVRPEAVEIWVAQRSAVGDLAANSSVDQAVEVFERHADKLGRLSQLLRKELRSGGGSVVFVKTKKRCDWLAGKLEEEGYCPWVHAIHSGKQQRQREATLATFRKICGGDRVKRKRHGDDRGVLVATNVAARGLHIAGVPLVVVYDFCSVADYVHQVGRTGRAGARGKAVSFYVPGDGEARVFVGTLEAAEVSVPESLRAIAKAEASLKQTTIDTNTEFGIAASARHGVKRKRWQRQREGKVKRRRRSYSADGRVASAGARG